MELGHHLQNLIAEVTCLICGDYFKDPVTTKCGHNFCKTCITRRWAKLAKNLSCPVCRAKFKTKTLQPNRQLGNVAAAIKQMNTRKRKREKRYLCDEHEEELTLFCRDDQETICVVCGQSEDHRSHAVCPIEEAALQYKPVMSLASLPSSVADHLNSSCSFSEAGTAGDRPLNFTPEELDVLAEGPVTNCSQLHVSAKSQGVLESHRERLKKMLLKNEPRLKDMESNKTMIRKELKYLQELLTEKRYSLYTDLQYERVDVLEKLKERRKTLSKYYNSLQNFISELQSKIEQPDREILKGMRSIMSR